MKKLFMLFVALCLTGVVKAQFSSSSEVYVYVKTGESLSKNISTYACYFSSGNAIVDQYSLKIFQDWYREDPTLYKKLREKGSVWEYDSENSTYKRTTYHYHIPASSFWGTAAADVYLSFSKDRESLIWWEKGSDDKTYYRRVSLSEIAPKSQNKDFLYE